MSIIIDSTTNRKECYTCASKKRQKNPLKTLQHQEQFFNGQILLNTSKILKGNKKNLKQFLRNQILKSRCSNSKSKIKSQSNFNSIARTADTTPRQNTYLNSDFNTIKNQQDEKQYQTMNSKKSQAKSQSHIKQKMKMLTENFCKKQFSKLYNSSAKNNKNNIKIILKQQMQELSFRQSAFSKQLVSYQNDQSKKPITFKPYDSKIQLATFKSSNLENRMNEYMNVLIQKSQKDQLNILETIISQRKDEDMEKIKVKEEKVMQKMRQKNILFCKKLKISCKNRHLKRSINKNIQQNEKHLLKRSISPKYKSIDITWRDIVQENKESELAKNILKMHKNNQIKQNSTYFRKTFMQNNFLRYMISKDKFQL